MLILLSKNIRKFLLLEKISIEEKEEEVSMKLSIFMVALVLLKLTIHINCQCEIVPATFSKNGYISSVIQLVCTGFNENYFAYSNEYENVTYIYLAGDFTDIGFDSRYFKFSYVLLNSESLVNFKMDHFKNLTLLESIKITSNNVKIIDLKLNDESIIFDKLETFEINGAKSILGSFTDFLNLKRLCLYSYKVGFFDFSLLPNSLVYFTITSNRETALVNQHSLKQLSYLNEIDVVGSKITLNASFIPCSLKELRIKNLISQKFLEDTNITFLQLHHS